MDKFSISSTYKDNQGRKTIDVNPLPLKYCSFDCVFCPLGKTQIKTDKSFIFEETKELIFNIRKILEEDDIKVVFINPWGEGLANKELLKIIKLIKSMGLIVRLLSNGYIFNYFEYKETLENVDELIGEIAAIYEEDFIKYQRPIGGYTLEDYINNMANFNNNYKGKFILDITILNIYRDNEEAIIKLKEIIYTIKPDEIFLETPKGKFKELGVTEKELDYIRQC